MPTNDDTTTSDRPDESAVGAAAAAGASDAVARAVAAAKTGQLNPAQVVHRLHTAAHEYTIEAFTGDDEDRAYTRAVADELRSAAASVSADDHTAGVWDGDTFRTTNNTDTPTPPRPRASDTAARPNMSQYIREPLFPAGYRTQPPA